MKIVRNASHGDEQTTRARVATRAGRWQGRSDCPGRGEKRYIAA